MLLLVGQVARGMRGREAFQEVDYEAMFGPLAKWACEIREVERIPELVARAFSVATSGRPGSGRARAAGGPARRRGRRRRRSARRAGAGGIPAPRTLARAARAARREPSGRSCSSAGSRGRAEAAADLQAFCEASSLPVGASFRCQDYVDNRSPSYVGHVGIGPDPRLAARVREADVLLVVGARLGEMTTSGYTLVEPPVPRQTLIHVHAGAEEIGRVYRPTLGIVASPAAVRGGAPRARAARRLRWAEWTRRRARRLRGQPSPPADARPGRSRRGDGGAAGGAARGRDPDERRRQLLRLGAPVLRVPPLSHLLAPTSGAMGYGVPAAVAAKAVHPDRPASASRATATSSCPRTSSRRPSSTSCRSSCSSSTTACTGRSGCTRSASTRAASAAPTLVNPDFAAFARSFGAHGETVERTDDFEAAFERALAAGRPAVLHLPVDPDAITPRTTLTALREAALGG